MDALIEGFLDAHEAVHGGGCAPLPEAEHRAIQTRVLRWFHIHRVNVDNNRTRKNGPDKDEKG
jgi:hypothetical protein